MGLFSKLFKNNKQEQTVDASLQKIVRSEEADQFINYLDFIETLLNQNKYISRKEYIGSIDGYKELIVHFSVLNKSNMLEEYCKQNTLNYNAVISGLDKYSNIISLVDAHNEKFLEESLKTEKEYLDNILKDVDPVILLDEDQRKVILSDEDYCLVIAGAGAGKTTTVAAKVKYLVEKQGINPKQILVVSFTNKAVNELKDKINKDLNIDCPICTFHSTGNAIIHKNSPDEKLNIVDTSTLYITIRDYLKGNVLKNERMVNNLIMFFASYFDAPFEGDDLNAFFNKVAKGNYSTLKSEIEDYKKEILDRKSKKYVTILNEMLRSHQEVEIANFLYLNSIDYEYEPIYPYNIANSKKPYTPDFVIRQGDKVAYIEHFGINEDGTNFIYSEAQLNFYKKAINDKVLLHRQHQTPLIYTFSSYNDRRSITDHLKEKLDEMGFVLNPKSNQEVMEKLISGEENRYIVRLVNLLVQFISNFKVNGFTEPDFTRLYNKTQNVRSRLFLDICRDCYLEYERVLKERNEIDFQDMINESARLLAEVKELKQKLDFKYIIVDEYQDISRQRFDLTKNLADVTDAKIIAVGDDWQSIYAFSGSDITLFTNFAEKMGYAKLLKIVKTYRNSQEVIDIAGNFIQRNTEQIQKRLISPKNITDPVIVYTYDSTRKKANEDRRSGANYAIAHSVEVALDQIVEYARIEGKNVGSILLLGRFGFDGDRLERSGLFEYITRGGKIKSVKYPKLDITFMTAHASKGLGYDNVIVVNGRNETYGFPSKIEDDPVLAFVIRGDRSIDYAEERRLFYVAMTRTKNRVYFIAPEQNPSEFLLEIKKDYKNVVLRGNWNEEEPQNLYQKKCPICGFPLKFRYKNAYGLKLYICSNEPEMCSFMTNDLSGKKLSIMKCDKCHDGYLIVKKGKNNPKPFLGCTNYQSGGTGCNNSIWKEDYYKMMGYELEADFTPEVKDNKESSIKKETTTPVSTTKSSYIDKPKETYTDESSIDIADMNSIIYNGYDLNKVIFTILNALQHISLRHYYGLSILRDVLKGSESKKVLDAKLNYVTEYGALSTMNRDDVMFILNWMLEKHFMIKTSGPYPVIHITAEGLDYKNNITKQALWSLRKKLEVPVYERKFIPDED